MFSMKAIASVNAFVVGVLLVLGPCDESLPPYGEPEQFLEGSMRAEYFCNVAFGNRMIAYLVVQNIYEETLDDTAQFRGTLEFRSVRRPEITKTFTIGADDLVVSQSYDRITRRLTLNPQDSLVFAVSWDVLSDDHGVDPRRGFSFYYDPLCSFRCIAKREEFALSGEIQIFSQRAPVRASLVFPLCYYSVVAPTTVCIAAQTYPTCIVQADTTLHACSPFGEGG